MSGPDKHFDSRAMASILPDELARRLGEAERAATLDRRPRRRDWLVLAVTAIVAPVVILLIGWIVR